MKAIVLAKYGTPDDLVLTDVGKPVPKDDQVLIRVQASAVNDWDWGLVRGKPFYIRALIGLLAPKISIIGCDVAGQVEAVGKGVTTLRAGDDVYGDLSESGFGSFAEYACASQESVALKPPKSHLRASRSVTARSNVGSAESPRNRGYSRRSDTPHQWRRRWCRHARVAT